MMHISTRLVSERREERRGPIPKMEKFGARKRGVVATEKYTTCCCTKNQSQVGAKNPTREGEILAETSGVGGQRGLLKKVHCINFFTVSPVSWFFSVSLWGLFLC